MAAKRKKLIKVEDAPHLVRDEHTKAIINTDRSAYVNSRLRKRRLLEKDETIATLKADIEQLKADFKLITDSLKKA